MTWAVVLDTVLTPELKRKGALRELMRQYMNLRKNAGLKPNDRVTAFVASTETSALLFLKTAEEDLKREIRADNLEISETPVTGYEFESEVKTPEWTFSVGLRKS